MILQESCQGPCQAILKLTDSVGVDGCSCQNKIVWPDPHPQITPFSTPELPVSLNQFDFGFANPVRAEIGKSCQDCFAEGGASTPKTPILTGQNRGQTPPKNPVRVEVVGS